MQICHFILKKTKNKLSKHILPEPVGPKSNILLFSSLSSCDVLSKISEPEISWPGLEVTGFSKDPPKLNPIPPFPRPAIGS